MATSSDQVTELETLAGEVLELKRSSIPRRPIIIEFCGSPKAGKTSCLNSLDIFLRRNGFRTAVLAERASMCPVRSKFDPTFNVWTACMSLAQMCDVLSNRSKDLDVVLLDRGVFDAICWFHFQHEKLALDRESLTAFCNFFAARKWRAIIDLVYVFTSTPRTSMDREYSTLLTRKTGSIMRPNVLNGLKRAISQVVSDYRPLFRNVKMYDTTGKTQNDVSYFVTRDILEILRAQISERIGYFLRKDLQHIDHEIFEYREIAKRRNLQLKFAPRSTVENNDNYVQPIPIAVFTDKDHSRVLVARKASGATGKFSPESNKYLLYFGGHVRAEDKTSDDKQLLDVVSHALCREIKEELDIDFVPSSSPAFLIWDRSNPRSAKHIAMCFVFEKNLDFVRVSFDKNEFVRGRHGRFNEIVSVNEFVRDVEDVERWTEIVLERVLGRDYAKERKGQLKLGFPNGTPMH